MAEIGIIASIAGIAAAGTKLSVALFDFGATIGSAGSEIRLVASEISLFCAVLRQVQSKLRKAKTSRYSLGAIQTTQEILDKCDVIFKEIEVIIDGLRKAKVGPGGASVDWKARIKWTMKRSQIQVQRTTLESCKITLNIMLLTLEFDRKVSLRRRSTLETEKEDEEENQFTKSLVNAHKYTVETLKKLEDKRPKEATEQPEELSIKAHTPSISPQSEDTMQEAIGNTVFEPTTNYSSSRSGKRASLWASKLMYGPTDLANAHAATTKPDDSSYQLNYFLQKWTNQNYLPSPIQSADEKGDGSIGEMLNVATKTSLAQHLLSISERYAAQLKATYYSANNTFDELCGHQENNHILTNMEKRALKTRSNNLDEFLVVLNRELLEVKQYNRLNITLAENSRTLQLGKLDATAARDAKFGPLNIALTKIPPPKRTRSKSMAAPNTQRPQLKVNNTKHVRSRSAAAIKVVHTQNDGEGAVDETSGMKSSENEIVSPIQVPAIKSDEQLKAPEQSSKPATQPQKKKKIGWRINQDSLPPQHGRFPYPLINPSSSVTSILAPLVNAFAEGPSQNYSLFVQYARVERLIQLNETPLQAWKKMSMSAPRIDGMVPYLVVKYEDYEVEEKQKLVAAMDAVKILG